MGHLQLDQPSSPTRPSGEQPTELQGIVPVDESHGGHVGVAVEAVVVARLGLKQLAALRPLGLKFRVLLAERPFGQQRADVFVPARAQLAARRHDPARTR